MVNSAAANKLTAKNNCNCAVKFGVSLAGRGVASHIGVSANPCPRAAMSIELSRHAASLPPKDLAALAQAVELLEHTSLAARLTNLLGKQVELVGKLVPRPARAIAARATTMALRLALRTTLRSMDAQQRPASRNLHKAMAAGAGAIGGAFGFTALPLEVPASTMLMLRSIVDIARAEGEDLTNPETALSCLEVFALGGRTPDDDSLESSYFGIRAVLAQTISEATKYILRRGVVDESAPILVKMIAMISSRFGVVITQKMAAQMVPVIGAVGGAAVNYAFVDHFQSIARGHFTVRRLERAYGVEVVRAEYEKLRMKDVTPKR